MSKQVNLPGWIYPAAAAAFALALFILLGSERSPFVDVVMIGVIALSGAVLIGGLLNRGRGQEPDPPSPGLPPFGGRYRSEGGNRTDDPNGPDTDWDTGRPGGWDEPDGPPGRPGDPQR